MNSYRLRAFIYIIIVTIIWGLAEPVIKFTLGGIPPLLFLTYRFGISTVIAIITIAIFGAGIPKDKKLLTEIILYEIASTLSLALLFFGLENTTVLDTTLIGLANPLIISLAGMYFLKEHVTKREKIGMGIALLGTFLVVAEPFLQNDFGSIRLSGNILIFFYLLATAWSAVLAKRLLKADVNPLFLTNFFFIFGFIVLLPFALFKFNVVELIHVPFSYHLGVIFMAVMSGSLAYYLSNKAQKSIEISEASVFSYLYPVIAAPIAVIWLGEKITPMFIIGAIVITLGVIIAEVKKKRVASQP
jgi:drug/metabolite transporter (DMT)-like permease